MRKHFLLCVMGSVLSSGAIEAQTTPQDFRGARLRVTGVASDDSAQSADLKEWKAQKGHRWLYAFFQRECPADTQAAPWVLSEEEISLIDAAGQAHAVADIVDKGDDYVVEPSTYPLRFDCKSHLATLCSGWEQVRVLFHVPKQAKPARLRIGDKEFTLDDKAVATGNYTKVSSASCR